MAVDEPETHLHPAAQRRVGRMLQGAQRQAIVSTHSPEVLAQFDPMYVVALTPGHRARQLARSPYSSGKRKDRPRWWSARRLEPLTARSLILVEGIADRIVVEAAADALGLDLDRQGVTVVEVNGAQEFPKALKLFGADGFDIPIALLVDENEVPVVAAALGVDDTEVAEHRVWICRKDLEAQYIADLTPERVRQCLIESGEYSAAQLPDLRKVKGAQAAMTEHCSGSSKVRSAMGLAAAMTKQDAEKSPPRWTPGGRRGR